MSSGSVPHATDRLSLSQIINLGRPIAREGTLTTKQTPIEALVAASGDAGNVRDCKKPAAHQGSTAVRREEQTIHKAVAAHLRQRGVPGLVWWHTQNNVHGGRRKHHIQGAIAKGLGVRAGVADLVALHDGKFFALELKAPGGRPTEDQLKFMADVDQAGGYTCIAEGIDAALRCLETWGLVRGVAA